MCVGLSNLLAQRTSSRTCQCSFGVLLYHLPHWERIAHHLNEVPSGLCMQSVFPSLCQQWSEDVPPSICPEQASRAHCSLQVGVRMQPLGLELALELSGISFHPCCPAAWTEHSSELHVEELDWHCCPGEQNVLLLQLPVILLP